MYTETTGKQTNICTTTIKSFSICLILCYCVRHFSLFLRTAKCFPFYNSFHVIVFTAFIKKRKKKMAFLKWWKWKRIKHAVLNRSKWCVSYCVACKDKFNIQRNLFRFSKFAKKRQEKHNAEQVRMNAYGCVYVCVKYWNVSGFVSVTMDDIRMFFMVNRWKLRRMQSTNF